ncbi:MAG: hypothetical protein ABIP75_00430, partial [Pyrinomonadaceae bacterium]
RPRSRQRLARCFGGVELLEGLQRGLKAFLYHCGTVTCGRVARAPGSDSPADSVESSYSKAFNAG